MFLRSLVKLNNSISVQNFAPKFRSRPIEVFAAFWFDVSSEFRISYCQVGNSPNNRGGQTYFAPFSIRPEGAPAPPKIDATGNEKQLDRSHRLQIQFLSFSLLTLTLFYVPYG